ncbi:MAG: hypothetical protein K2N73_17540 [Lachnospiraceae bacterium]|nr:hypothetical protein [Lachnospiraceae bacterium]
MNLARAQNAKRNIYSGIINKTTKIFLPFFIRAFLIQKLGIEYLGLDSLFSSVLQVLNLAELGFGSAIVYNMYKPIAENDEVTICALLKFYRNIYQIMGTLIFVIGMILMPFIPHLINGEYPSNLNVRALYFIYLVNTSMTYFMYAYKTALLNAYQRVDLLNNVSTFTSIVLNISQLIILYGLKNYYLFLLAMPACTCLNNIINSIIVKKMYPRLICKGLLSAEIKNQIKEKVLGLAVYQLCSASRNTFDSIFISKFLNISLTAIYANYLYVIVAVLSFLSIIKDSILAGVGNSIVQESVEKNYNDMKKINFIYMWLSGWCTVCLLCLFQPFMELWMGSKLMFDYSVVVLLSIYFYAQTMGTIRALYSDAKGLWYENRKRTIAESISNLILNFILVQIMGIHGIIFATLISLIIFGFGLSAKIVFQCYFKNGKLGEFFLSHLRYAAVTAFISVIMIILCSYITLSGITGLILKFLICCTIPNIGYFMIYYHTQDYKDTIPWLLKTFGLDKKLSIFMPR